MKNNIVLIGMSGAGKSSIGRIIAKKVGFQFVDGDDLIQKVTGKTTEKIINDQGEKYFLETEKTVYGKIDFSNKKSIVFSPGGSIIYYPDLLKQISKTCLIIYINTPFHLIEQRLSRLKPRGIIGLKDKNLKQLYQERNLLYKRYSDFYVDTKNLSKDELVTQILEHFTQNHQPFKV